MSCYSESEFDPQDERWDDWSEAENESLQCLFCPEVYQQVEELFDHCKEAHSFDFVKTKAALALDFYQCIRLINYIRKEVEANPNFAGCNFTGAEPFFQDDTFLKPVLEEDALLYAFEDMDLEDPVAQVKPVEVELETETELERSLAKKLRAAEEKLAAAEELARNLNGQFAQYRQLVKENFFDNIDDPKPDVRIKELDQTTDKEMDYYFSSYAHSDIHEQMLKDRVRTEGYRDFMYENKNIFKDKVVLDVGCGTGILSMFAARSGAAKVIAVDNSAIIEKARMIVEANNLSDKIVLIRGKIEEIKLPVESVDIIISEWMGYFLLFEAMLDSVLVARDRWLAPGGLLCPSVSRIFLTAIEDEEYINERYDFWKDVYGFDMSIMQEPMLKEAQVDVIDGKSVIATAACVKDIDHSTISSPSLDFNTPFTIKATRTGVIHGFLGYFDIYFAGDGGDGTGKGPNVGNPVIFTTGPHGIPTHWKQTVFLLDQALSVTEGAEIKGTIRCQKNLYNPRELDIELSYGLVDPENPSTEVKLTHKKYYLK
ncbi:S-adenosyl-L-methionine-dependent methyltransferase [Basidiobolus meristosporus CBS 931.73]|uniref:type I protein arginine methyltransferase n=1 Tax=Basidiobolus meristosporus CBS 931.73 TaxID=1314790 RepID=A0A1Y1XXX6_9FUNG|nr:S-adenosyl-L-methionine-dependent methyltransferase [Basidiobolus meristosporus CBS 931.73]|eukprot:ORX90214.1 S-adenosyl-L-methionine-dependent methyltransferase [Basidiobolus meristosporus CBS 931.73]